MDIASAAALQLGPDGSYFHVTGTTTITSISKRNAGDIVVLEFDGALTFTHNATTLILHNGADRTTAAGDVCILVSEGAGNWREVSRNILNRTRRRHFDVGGAVLSAGTGVKGVLGSTTNFVSYPDAETCLWVMAVPIPEDLVTGTGTIYWVWTTAASTAGNARFRILVTRGVDATNLNSAGGAILANTAQYASDGTANVAQLSSVATGSITAGQGGLWLGIERQGADANDTLNGDTVRVHAAWIEYTANV